LKYFFVWILLPLTIVLLFYILWINGYLMLSRKTSKLFICSFRHNKRCRIKFACCNGYIKKIVKFKENRSYVFIFNCDVKEGVALVEIQDKNKKLLLHLDSNTPKATLNIDKKCRYYIVLKFEKASGEYELSWN